MAKNQPLRFFLDTLEKNHPLEILDIRDPMPRDFIFMALAKELDKEEFPPIIRTKIDGYDMPVVGNVFAGRKRIANMLGFDDESRIAENWGLIDVLTAAGAEVIPDTCPDQPCWHYLAGKEGITESPKCAYYPRRRNINFVIRDLDTCIETALTGEVR